MLKMEDKKRYSKTKIFLFLIFAILGIVLLTQVVKVIRDGIVTINEKNIELKCVDLNYQINDFSYENNRLIFEILSKDYDTNITKVTIITDVEEEHVKNIIPSLKGGEGHYLTFNNITIQKTVYIYVEDCKNHGLEKEI